MFKELMNKITGADKTPKERYNDDINKRQKRFDKILKEKETRQKMQGECAAVLNECRTAFSRCINTERARSNRKRAEGYDTSVEEARIREAAVGIMIVDEAKYKLQAISSESDLNMAMNRLGMALRQLHRMDNSSTAVSPSTERILEDWCPGLMGESGDLTFTQLEVPPEMRGRINEAFVNSLLAGNNYDTTQKMLSYQNKTAPQDSVAQPVSQPVSQAKSTDSIVEDLLDRARGASNSGEVPEDISRFRKYI